MSTHFSRLFCAILLLALPCAALAQSSGEEFTIIALPDTQYYSRDYPEIFHAQTQWIVDQREARNIRLVVHMGDLVDGGGRIEQWQNASAAISTLEGVVPYVLPLGNHDYDLNDPANRTASTKNFNSYFGPLRYQEYSWYAGHWPAGSNENFYALLNIHGHDYLVLALEYAPRAAALEWASSVVSAYPDHDVLVVTHSHMQADDRRLVPGCYPFSAPNYGMTDYNEGDALWNKFLSRHKNIFLVLSGHSIASDGAGRRADLGVHGNLVNQILSNYQHYPQGGGGYLRILRVRPALNLIEVSTYSPYLDQWLTDPRHQFSVPLREAAPTSSAGSLDGFVRHNCQPVAGATVATKAGTAETTTEGYYKLDLPAPDVYAVTAEKSGAGAGAGSTVVQPGYTSALDLFLACQLSATDPSVTICAPGDGATVISPVRIRAGVTSSTSVNLMQVYIDGQKAYEASVSELDVSLDIAEGTRRLTVQARNSAGQWFNQSIHIQVADPSSPGACAASEDQSVKICTPIHGERVTSPARIVAGATSSHGVNLMQVYLDGKKVHEVAAAGVDTTLSMAEGQRRIAVQARDNSGAWFNSVINVHVESGACVLSATDPSVTICAPAGGSAVTSPVRIVAGTTSSKGVNLIQLYVDGAKVWEDYASQMDGSFALAAGTRRITVQARDSAGNWFRSSVNITVE